MIESDRTHVIDPYIATDNTGMSIAKKRNNSVLLKKIHNPKASQVCNTGKINL